MATKRPRIMFTPSERALAAIRRVAKVTKKPASYIVSEQVEVMVDHLENLATILEHADRLKRDDPEAVKAAAKTAFEQMLPILDQAESELTGIWDELAEASGLTPSSSNTGATFFDSPPKSGSGRA